MAPSPKPYPITPDLPIPDNWEMYSSLAGLVVTLAVVITVTQADLVDHVHTLLSRQDAGSGVGINPDIIPDQCKAICAPLNDVSSNICTTPDCICGDRISGAMSGCLQCALDTSGLVSFIPESQQIYNNYTTLCAEFGKTVPSHTFQINGTSSIAAGPSATGGVLSSAAPITPAPRPTTVTVTAVVPPTTINAPPPPIDPSATGGSSGGGSGSSSGSSSGGVTSGCSRITPIASAGLIGTLAAVLALVV